MGKLYTVKIIQEMLDRERRIVEVYRENKWVVLVIDNGIKVKIIDF